MRLPITLRLCETGDENALSLIGQATFLETYAGVLGGNDIIKHCAKAHSKELYVSWLLDSSYKIWLAEISPGQAPVGYMVLITPQPASNDLSTVDSELKRIYILGKFQGGGVGKLLLNTATEHARIVEASRLVLGVYAGNDSAISFYQKAGFEQIGQRQFNVGGQDYDDHVMGLNL